MRRVVSVGRLIGLALIVLALGVGNWLLTDARFDLDPSKVTYAGLAWSAPEAVAAAVAVPDLAGTNALRLSTAPIAARVGTLPAVATATVAVVLPDGLAVTIVERQPVFRLGLPAGRSFAVDVDGRLLAELPAVGQLADAAAALPLVDDGRADSADMGVGDRLDSIDLAAMLTLAAVTPADLDSAAPALRLVVDDEHGFTLGTDPPTWQAIFGFYTVSVRPTSIIDRQLQCLRSLVANGEAEVETVYLEPSADRCGTFVPRESPSPIPVSRSE